MAFCASSAVAFVLVTVFQCHPIVYVWEKDIKGGRCVNYNSVAWSNAGINIFQDIIIILLPMNELRHLKLSRKKKVGMYAMFGVGGLSVPFSVTGLLLHTSFADNVVLPSSVVITSIVRLDSLRTFGLTADPTWDNIPTTFWSTLETTTAIFCACMPSIRAGLIRLFPRLMGSTVFTSSMPAGRPAESQMLSLPGGSDNKTVPPRIVEKIEQRFISLLPLKSHIKLNQTSIARTNLPAAKDSSSDVATQDDIRRKELTIQSASFTTAKEGADVGYNKPLPLTPMSKASFSPNPSTTTTTDWATEGRIDDIEKMSGTGNWTNTSDDVSHLL